MILNSCKKNKKKVKKKMTLPNCEMAKSMNDESMMLEIDNSLCAVSGCKNKAIKSVNRGVSVPVCKEHQNSV